MRFLAVLPLVPYPPDRGDRMRAWEMITALSSLGHLTLAIVASEAPSTALAALRQFAKEVYTYRLNVPDRLWGMARGVVRGFPLNISRYWSEDVRKRVQAECAGPWDLILAYQLRAAPYVRGLRGGVRVLDLTDSLALYRRQLPWHGRSILHRLALMGVERLEMHLPRVFDVCWVSAPDDAARLAQLSGTSPRVVPNGCFPVSQPAPFQPDGPVVFIGDMRYPPNEDAILSFARRIWPLVRQKEPRRRLRILGRPTRPVLALSRMAGVEVAGARPSLECDLQDAGVVVNPVRFGTGSSRKILDAWAAARPVVSTRAGTRGLLCREGAEVLLADTPDEWCASLSWLTRHPAEAEDLGRRGWMLARAKYDAQVIWRKAFSSVLGGGWTQPEVAEGGQGLPGGGLGLTVLLVITVSEPGGAQRHVRDLMAGLRGQVRFLLATSGAGWLVEQAHALGVPVISLDVQRDRLGWRDFRAMLRLVNVIRREGVTIVHCHSYKAGLLGRVAALLARRPSMYTVHGFAFKDLRYSWIARTGFLATEWILGKITARVITVTRADSKLSSRLRIVPLSRVAYVPNGVDVPARSPDVRPAAQGAVVGTMARLIQKKGVDELLEAIRLLLPLYPEITLRIAGDGPWRSMLEAHVRKFGLQRHVRFLGWVEDVEDFLAGIDVFVLSSWKEGAPYALLDAMAHGKAIVATNVGGIPEILHANMAGLTVRPGDVRALSAAISFFITHPRHRVEAGRIAQSIVRERFRREEMVGQTYAIYSKAPLETKSRVQFPDGSRAGPDNAWFHLDQSNGTSTTERIS